MQTVAIEELGAHAVGALDGMIVAEHANVGCTDDEQVPARTPAGMRRLAVDGERPSAPAMNGMLKFDIAMFSGHENCLRAPPDARVVDANS